MSDLTNVKMITSAWNPTWSAMSICLLTADNRLFVKDSPGSAWKEVLMPLDDNYQPIIDTPNNQRDGYE